MKNPKRSRRARTKKIDDWRELRPGQKIKVTGRSGPYYQPRGIRENRYMGRGGVFVVKFIDQRGIGCTSTGLLGSFHYLYMGRKRRWKELPTIWQAPHKIRLVAG